MSPSADNDQSTARIRALHEARAKAELTQADGLCPGADAIPWRGDLLAQVMVVKGLPGPAEAAGGAAVSGADGEALLKAITTLGWPAEQTFYTLSRPEPGLDSPACADRIRAQIEAIDPVVVIALDDVAASDIATGYGIAPLVTGEQVRAAGRRLVAIGGMEASLADDRLKRAVWTQLQVAKPAGPSY
jgi:uracil-DNA glycosylase